MTRAIIAGVERNAVARGWNGIACDHPGCRAEINVERTHNPAVARAEAEAAGWRCREGNDFCPLHRAAEPPP